MSSEALVIARALLFQALAHILPHAPLLPPPPCLSHIDFNNLPFLDLSCEVVMLSSLHPRATGDTIAYR